MSQYLQRADARRPTPDLQSRLGSCVSVTYRAIIAAQLLGARSVRASESAAAYRRSHLRICGVEMRFEARGDIRALFFDAAGGFLQPEIAEQAGQVEQN